VAEHLEEARLKDINGYYNVVRTGILVHNKF